MPAVLDSRALAVLQRVPFLHEVPAAALQELAADLPVEQVEAGELIARQGQPARSLLILLQGKAQVQRGTEDEPQRLADLAPGDLFGDLELVHQRPFHADLVAVENCSVLVWERRALEDALKPWPGSVRALRFSADGRRLALSMRADWLAEGENVLALSRKDINILLQSLSLPVILAGVGLGAAAWGASAAASVLAWAGGVLIALGLGYGLWRWLDWRNDYYLVTDRRAVWLEKVIGLYDSRQEAPLHMVLSVSVGTDFLGRALGYGDVIIRTYTGQLTFQSVRLPRAMAAVIEEGWRRVRQAQDRQDREGVGEALRSRLEAPAEFPDEAELPQELPEEAPRARESIGLDHWTFQVRFEQGGVITYRKHWAVLLRSIALPSILVLLLVGVVGSLLGGLIRVSSLGSGLLIAGALLAPAFTWWAYRYVDWANDLYQVTPEQIVDVYKRPLSRELRKVAPLENILGTQVKRRGLIGLLLDYGDVVAQVGTSEFTFEGVYHPALVQQDIVRAQETLLERRREAERLQRRGELVEWFSAYHQETQAPREGEPEDAQPR